jgi:hypothetical protein
LKARALAVATLGGLVFAGAGVYARQTPEARPDAAHPSATCGSERWLVKTLADPAASKVNFASVKPRSVEDLRHLKAPKNLKATTPRHTGAERTVFSVKGLLMSMKREDDSDIHLVVADPKLGGSMIVEFPAASCATAATPVAQTAMAQARADLAGACGGEPGVKPVTLTGLATITGVGLFDPIHGQAGVAPNGIELHPALSFTSADCKRVKPQGG